MKTIMIAMGLVAALVLPAAATAKPDQSDRRDARAECKAERGKSKATREAFRGKYGSFKSCMRQTAAEEEQEGETAHKNAAKECKAEREEMGSEAFAEAYGTNANKKNAFGKCVSTKAKQKEAEEDAEDAEEAKEFRNAAKECAAEREEMGDEAFAEAYGTNENKKNAFG
jgi:hypothetical protein